MLMKLPPERIQVERLGLSGARGNIWDKLGQCAKMGSHNGPKCLTVAAEH